ncbi:MAG: hypothetical protein N4A53_00935 [Pelagimonas sp.]|jgi:hypothetical protein|nr:hypothetical protein [Pelagimonas sp.]
MKIALGIVGILLSLIVMMQSCTITGLSGLADNAETGAAGAIGLISGFIFFVAAALSFSLPRAAGVTFLLSALLASAGAQDFPDLAIWAAIAGVMGVMAFLTGYLAKRKKKGEQNA